MNFEPYCFGDLTINYDKRRIPLSSKDRSNRQGQYRYYGAQGVIDHVDNYLFDGRYLLIAEDGENLSSLKQKIAQIVEGKFWVNNHAHIVQCNEKCRLDYLYYVINSMDLSGYITGSAQPKLSQSNLNAIQLKIPSIEEQDRIISVIKPFDEKIKVNNAINDNLQQQLAIAFDEIYAEGRCGQLDELLATVESGSRPRGGAESVGIPSIGAENIERFGIYDFSKDKYISESYFLSLKRGVVQSGDVLLYKDGAYTGKVSMALDEFPHKHCAVNEHVFILRTAKARFQNALYFLMTRDDIRQKVFALASSKAAQPGLNQSELRSIPIQIPTENALIAFEQYANPMMHLIANNAKESKRLAELRDTLLPKLMSGEIDVSEVEI